MIGPRRRRGLLSRSDDGVSTVVGAVLVAALLMSVLIAIKISFVPEWDKDAESRQMRLVENQMATILGLIDQQVNNGTTTPLSAPVHLSQGRSSIFSDPHPAHQLDFLSDRRTIRLSAPKLVVVEDNGTSLAGIQETWSSLVSSTSVINISSIESFRVRLASVDDPNDGDSVTLTVTNRLGAFAGDLKIYVTTYPSGYNVNVRTRDALGTVLYDQGDAYFSQNPVAPYFVDVLDARYRFGQVLAAALTPYAVGMTVSNVGSGPSNQDLSASYALTFWKVGPDGSVIVASGGVVRAPFSTTLAADRLWFKSHNSRFPNQDFILEGGGIVLSQTQGAAFASPPTFHASLVGNTTHVEIVIPELRGDNASVSSQGTASVSVRSIGSTGVVGLAPRIDLTIATSRPALWTSFWSNELDALPGYSPGTQFSVQSTTDTATLTILGASASANYNDLVLEFRSAEVEVSVTE